MRRIVVDLADQRPIFRLPDGLAASIRAALPDGWELVVATSTTDGTGDGAGKAAPETLAAVAGAEVYMGMGVPAEILRAGPRLRWVHTATAGVGSSLSPEMRERDITFTNSAGVHAPPIAEMVVGMILYFARGLDFAVLAQRDARWDKTPFDEADTPVREVDGSTVGVLGFGGIGREVARRAAALGARVLALKRRRAEPPPGVELFYGDAGLAHVLEHSDYVVVAMAHTPATRGLLDHAAFARIKPGAVLVNVARGRIVDEAALLAALEAGRLRGAALDVFVAEPLPAGHPFWRRPDVLVTPHVSAYSRRFWDREAALILENLSRYLEGRPLRNVVDTEAGY